MIDIPYLTLIWSTPSNSERLPSCDLSTLKSRPHISYLKTRGMNVVSIKKKWKSPSMIKIWGRYLHLIFHSISMVLPVVVWVGWMCLVTRDVQGVTRYCEARHNGHTWQPCVSPESWHQTPELWQSLRVPSRRNIVSPAVILYLKQC